MQNKSLSEWRKSHLIEEMEKNLETWKQIRDNPKCLAKDRNEAAKNIARALAALQPDRTTAKSSEIRTAKPSLKPEHKKALQEILIKHG